MEDYYFPTSAETVHDHAGRSSRRRGSPPASPRHDDAGELRHHYLDACSRCGLMLAEDEDIFMYRGDTPFCSEECRQRQIEADEAREAKRSKQLAAAARGEQPRQRQGQQRIPLWAR